MTTPIVPTVTDELITELESGVPHENCSIPGAIIGALLAERAELKQQLAAASVDAERYRWLREACDNDPGNLGIEYACKPGVDAAIDAARNPSGD